MATKKFPSEMSSRGTVLGTDKILIYNATTGASDEVCTVAELFAYVYSAVTPGKVPYKTATVLANSPIFTNGSNVCIGGTDIGQPLSVIGATSEPSLDFNSVAIARFAGIENTAMVISNSISTPYGISLQVKNGSIDGLAYPILLNPLGGNIIIGGTTGSYSLTLANDSAGKPGAGGLWTVVSDARIKKDIEAADLDICYDTIKNIPLKRFAWADGVYSEEQVSDRHNLGWIAQDVQKYFSKAVSVKPFTKSEKIEDGVEEYQEQDFEIKDVEKTSIEIQNGLPVQVKSIVQEKELLFDELPVKDELGKVVLENGKPLLAKVPKMVTKTRPKFRQEVIEDCLDLNSGQIYAALYGAVQACMLKIESLEKEIALLKQ